MHLQSCCETRPRYRFPRAGKFGRWVATDARSIPLLKRPFLSAASQMSGLTHRFGGRGNFHDLACCEFPVQRRLTIGSRRARGLSPSAERLVTPPRRRTTAARKHVSVEPAAAQSPLSITWMSGSVERTRRELMTLLRGRGICKASDAGASVQRRSIVEDGKANAPAPHVGLLVAIAMSLGMWGLLYLGAVNLWSLVVNQPHVAIEGRSVPQLASLSDNPQVRLPIQTGRRQKSTQRRRHGPSFAARAFGRSPL